MKKFSLSELKGYFIRPASITFRFTDAQEEAYRVAADAYNAILPYTKATSVEMPEATSYYYYQFHVNQGTNSAQDIELRLEHRQRDSPDLENRTIIY
ncbi:MAG: hypothetical protein EOO63_02455 [Hymenobacter sp.]|nr:MAG: hypothetical protein EOO63_02455 [Hymenobacter sp.]